MAELESQWHTARSSVHRHVGGGALLASATLVSRIERPATHGYRMRLVSSAIRACTLGSVALYMVGAG